jgi:hypothetical protein
MGITRNLLSDSYGDFLRELKDRIRAAQLRATLSVKLILLYWLIRVVF